MGKKKKKSFVQLESGDQKKKFNLKATHLRIAAKATFEVFKSGVLCQTPPFGVWFKYCTPPVVDSGF